MIVSEIIKTNLIHKKKKIQSMIQKTRKNAYVPSLYRTDYHQQKAVVVVTRALTPILPWKKCNPSSLYYEFGP
jgi:predicted glutamine amidotransferase